MIRFRTLIRWAILGLAVGAVLVFTTDPGLIQTGPDGLLVVGYGVDSVFRFVPALAGAFVIAPAASLFTAGRFGVVLTSSKGRLPVWICFLRTLAAGASTIAVGVYLGAFLVSSLLSGVWDHFNLFIQPTIGFPTATPFSPEQVVLNALALGAFNWLVTIILIVACASIGMALRLRFLAAALPAVIGLILSVASDLRVGSYLDWRLKTPNSVLDAGLMTSWIGGFATLGGLALAAAAFIYFVAIRQESSGVWP